MKRVGLITSGGDGAGINCAIGAISESKIYDLIGFNDSFDGIISGNSFLLDPEFMGNKYLDGKQVIRTSRSKLPYTKEGIDEIKKALYCKNIDTLVICGGNGSLVSAIKLFNNGINTIYLPMTIDNDVNYSSYSIGYDTALNNILNTIKGLGDTSSNMPGRIFMVEVLGGNSGHLALESGLAGFADLVIIPEFSTNYKDITDAVVDKLKNKNSLIIVCSESAYEEKNYEIGNQGVSLIIGREIQKKTGIRVRHTIMGFNIRSGRPTERDALMGVLMGNKCKEIIENNEYGKMISYEDGEIKAIDFKEIDLSRTKKLDKNQLLVAKNRKMIIGGK